LHRLGTCRAPEPKTRAQGCRRPRPVADVARQGMESTGPLLRCPLVREHNRPLASLSASRPEASAGRPVPRRRANKDGIDALLVAAGVTENGADPSESLRDRAAAVEADVFRFLPRQSHQASPRCRIASPPKLPQRRVPSSQSRQGNEAVKSWPRSRTGIGEVEPAAGGSGGRRRAEFLPALRARKRGTPRLYQWGPEGLAGPRGCLDGAFTPGQGYFRPPSIVPLQDGRHQAPRSPVRNG
jgi:hypothetical protein